MPMRLSTGHFGRFGRLGLLGATLLLGAAAQGQAGEPSRPPVAANPPVTVQCPGPKCPYPDMTPTMMKTTRFLVVQPAQAGGQVTLAPLDDGADPSVSAASADAGVSAASADMPQQSGKRTGADPSGPELPLLAVPKD